MISVDLNCDLGESFGAYTIGMDEAVIPLRRPSRAAARRACMSARTPASPI